MKRRDIMTLGAGAVAVGLPAALRAQPTRTRVYWSTGQQGRSMKAAFVETYSDKADVEIQEGGDNPRFTQMQANRANPNFDVGSFIDAIMPLVVRSGLIAPMDEAAIPNLSRIPQSLRPWGAVSVPYAYGCWGILYNAAAVSRPIGAWSDLLRDDLRGRVTASSVTYNSTLYTVDAMARLHGGSLSDPEAGFDAMRRISQAGPGLWDQESIATGWLKTGEVVATPIYSGNALVLMDDPDVHNLRFVVPEEGGYIVPNNLVKVARSPNPAGADRLIDYILGDTAQAAWPSLGRSRPANPGVSVPPAIAAANPEATALRRLDLAWFAANRRAFVDGWNAVVGR